jgi:hypothetical protein
MSDGTNETFVLARFGLIVAFAARCAADRSGFPGDIARRTRARICGFIRTKMTCRTSETLLLTGLGLIVAFLAVVTFGATLEELDRARQANRLLGPVALMSRGTVEADRAGQVLAQETLPGRLLDGGGSESELSKEQLENSCKDKHIGVVYREYYDDVRQ